MGSLRDLKFLFPINSENLQPTEEKGNFYFVKRFDNKLYSMLLKSEGLAKTNIVGCGTNLRNCLEYFFDKELSLNTNEEMKSIIYVNGELSLVGCCLIAQQHPELGIEATFASKIRRISNISAHIESKRGDQYYDFLEICDALKAFQQMLKRYYAIKENMSESDILDKEYDNDYQPINECIVYAVEDGNDNYGFEKRYNCYKKTDSLYYYYVIKQYSSISLTETQKREIGVLTTLWHGAKPPRGIVDFECIQSEDGSDLLSDKKTFIVYKMNGKPRKLNPIIIREWTKSQKLEVLYLLADALSSIHKSGIFHRNINPSCIYTYEAEDEIGINLFDFELSKVIDSSITVVNSVKSKIDTNSVFVAPEVGKFLEGQPFDNIGWKEADVYSLGTLFLFILFDGKLDDLRREVQVSESVNHLPEDYPPDLKQLIAEMCSIDANRRPDIKSVKRTINGFVDIYD